MNNLIKIIDDPKMKTSELYAFIKEKTSAYSYWDDKELDKEFPSPVKKTVRYFKNQKDPDIMGKSADEMKSMPTMTLREYMIFYLQFKEETGEYPDEKGWTITSSRSSVGEVAYARRFGSGFWAYWDGGDGSCPGGGGREEVSLKSSLTLTLDAAIKICKENGLVVYKAM